MLLAFISRNKTISAVRVFDKIYRWISMRSLGVSLAEGQGRLTRAIFVCAPFHTSTQSSLDTAWYAVCAGIKLWVRVFWNYFPTNSFVVIRGKELLPFEEPLHRMGFFNKWHRMSAEDCDRYSLRCDLYPVHFFLWLLPMQLLLTSTDTEYLARRAFSLCQCSSPYSILLRCCSWNNPLGL